MDDKNTAAHGLCERLAQKLRQLLEEPEETDVVCAPRTLSLSVRVRYRAPGEAELCPLRNRLRALVDCVVEAAVTAEGSLERRPSVLLLVVATETARSSKLEGVVEDLLRQAGPYAPELQLRLVAEDQIEHEEDAWHLRWLEDMDPRAAPMPDNWRGGIEEGLQTVGRHLLELEEAKDPFMRAKLCQEGLLRSHKVSSLLVQSVPPNDVSSAGEGQSQEPIQPRPASSPPLSHIQLDWDERSLELACAPLTLVVGGNAAGKTRLAEQLNLRAMGLLRPRLEQPEGRLQRADSSQIWLVAEGEPSQWSDEADSPQQGQTAAGVAKLRETDKDSEADSPQQGQTAAGGPNEPPRKMRGPPLLAVFADDADLPRGTVGDLALMTWAADPANKEILTALAEVLRSLTRLEQDLGQELRAERAPARRANRKIWHSGDLVWLVRDWAWSGPLEEDDSDREEQGPDEAGTSGYQRRSSITESRKRIKGVKVHLPAGAIPPEQLAGFAQTVRRSASIWPDSVPWEKLKELDGHMGPNTVLVTEAIRSVRSVLAALRHELAELSESIAGSQFQHKELVDAVDRLLNLGVLPPTDAPRNTAAIVQRAQAERIARGLSMLRGRVPLLLVDEPTLGQDIAASARSLERLVRVWRVLETRRRLDMQSQSEASEPPSASSGLSLAPPAWMLPAQVLVVSYQDHALSAIADLEGLPVEEQAVRQQLEALVAPPWRKLLGEALQEKREALTRRLKRVLTSEELSWSLAPTDKRPADPPKEDWGKHALGACGRLGLCQMAADLKVLLNKDLQCGPNAGADAQRAANRREAAERLLWWLLQTGLLVSACVQGPDGLQHGGVLQQEITRTRPCASPLGPPRVRRLSPDQLRLPELPSAWQTELGQAAPAERRGDHPSDPAVSPRTGVDAATPPEHPLPANVAPATASVSPSARPVDLLTEGLDLPRLLDSTAGDVVVRVGSYNEKLVQAPGAHFFLFCPKDTAGPQELGRAYWALVALREALQAQGRRRVRLEPTCTPELGVLIGAALYRTSQIPMQVLQRTSAGVEELWDMDGPSDRTQVRVEERPGLGALHVYVSARNDVSEFADPITAREEAYVAHVLPSQGAPGATAIPGPAAARGWADAIDELLRRRPVRPQVDDLGRTTYLRAPARLFLATPNALSVAIGRALNPNAVGEVILMSFDPDRGYTEAVTIPPPRE